MCMDWKVTFLSSKNASVGVPNYVTERQLGSGFALVQHVQYGSNQRRGVGTMNISCCVRGSSRTIQSLAAACSMRIDIELWLSK